MLNVLISTDPLSPDGYEAHTVVSGQLVAFIREQFPTWPKTARVYKDSVAVENDITPRDRASLAELEQATEGVYYVIVYPGDPVTAIIAVVATLALTAAVLLFMQPNINPNLDIGSANNSLGNRSNKPRPNSRIPDIFGTVQAVPDLLTVPIITYSGDIEVEVAIMCLGRGEYEISKVRDGGTPLTLIAGAGAEFYAPFTSPNNSAPQLTVGAAVDAPFREVVRANEVNGQKLDPPNHNSVSGQSNIRFVAPNYIENNGTIDFTEFFGAGDDIVVTGANFATSGGVIDATTQRMRFHSDKRIEFETFDPSTIFSAGQTVALTNGYFAGQDAVSGDTIFIDVSGSYQIESVDGPSKTIQLV